MIDRLQRARDAYDDGADGVSIGKVRDRSRYGVCGRAVLIVKMDNGKALARILGVVSEIDDDK